MSNKPAKILALRGTVNEDFWPPTRHNPLMQIHQDYNLGAYTIRAYRTGEVVIAQPLPEERRRPDSGPGDMQLTTVAASVVVTPQRLLTDWAPQHHRELEPRHLENLLVLEPELVLLGTGRRLHFPPAAVTEPLLRRGIGVEVMDTAAACRTYNFLMADGRRVAAALLMIEGED